MEANTFIRFTNSNPKRIKQCVQDLISKIVTARKQNLNFVEITEIAQLVSGAEFEEKYTYIEVNRYINIDLIESFEHITKN